MAVVDVHSADSFFCDRSRMSTDTTTDSEHALYHGNTGRLRGAVIDCISLQRSEPIEASLHRPAGTRCGLAQPCATARWLFDGC